MKPVLIIGGGISGLSTAYWLTKQRIPCEVVEKQERFGGLLSSNRTEHGLVEAAANGFIANGDILELCRDVGVNLARTRPGRKKRFVFRGRPLRWPLGFLETLRFLKGVTKAFFQKKRFFAFSPKQTVGGWSALRFGEAATEWLIGPALQGVYAGNIERMSAPLVFSSFGEKRRRKSSRFKGTQAPQQGMEDLISHLVQWLKDKGVVLKSGQEVRRISRDLYGAVVVATSSFDLSAISDHNPELIPSLQIENLPLVSATLFYEKSPMDIEGFGCLFPRREGFYSLGVLFNESIFEGRSEKRSETWILGGAFRKDVCRFSDEEILRQIKEDRKRLYGINDAGNLLSYHITRWEKGLPHFNLDLEAQLKTLDLPSGVFLSGNYLGGIGLGQIVSRNRKLADRIKREFY